MGLDSKLYMLYDILGDTLRTGPLLWKVDRFRTEDIKDHLSDLTMMILILEKYFPDNLDYFLMIKYIFVHDIEETITGDITHFEGVSKEEKERVNNIAMNYITNRFDRVLDFNKLFTEYEEHITLEAKIIHMLDKVDSSIPFLKYDGETLINMDNPEVIEALRYSKAVIEGRKKFNTVGEIFFDYHLRNVHFTDEELIKYNISRETANKLTTAIREFMHGILIESKKVKELKEDFPKEAIIYNKHL